MTRRLSALQVGIGHIAFGSCLLARPERTAGLLIGKRSPVPAAWLVRILGARLLIQGFAEAALQDQAALVAGVGLDGVHALSMVPFTLHGRFRRAATTSAALALISAGAGIGIIQAERVTQARAFEVEAPAR